MSGGIKGVPGGKEKTILQSGTALIESPGSRIDEQPGWTGGSENAASALIDLFGGRFVNGAFTAFGFSRIYSGPLKAE